MKRNAISQWELTDHFWAESDPPEPCAAAAAAKSFLQKCARQFDRLTADDRRVKYRLSGGRDTAPKTRPRPRRSMDRVRGCGCCGGIDGHPRTSGADDGGNAIVVFDDDWVGGSRDYRGKDVTPLQHQHPPLCVIRRADDVYAATSATDRGTGTFDTVPYREVSTPVYTL